MDNEYDLLVRIVAFAVGAWTAGHYFLGAVALRQAAHWMKLILFPSLVMSGISICFAAVVFGSGVVFILCGPLVVLLSIKDKSIWDAGAYMSNVLDQKERMKKRERDRTNQIMNPVYGGVDLVVGEDPEIVTPSGWAAVHAKEERMHQ